jgi:hypothetical protein
VTTSRILRDAEVRPAIFVWNGPIDHQTLLQWLDGNDLTDWFPHDLLAFWEATGGGDVFETETLLGPFGNADRGDSFLEVNQRTHLHGMPGRLQLFHDGMVLSAVDIEDHDYVTLSSDGLLIVERFNSLDDWYTRTLRAEYAYRYGLPEARPS